MRIFVIKQFKILLSNSSSLLLFIISLSLNNVGILSFGSQLHRDIYLKTKKVFLCFF